MKKRIFLIILIIFLTFLLLPLIYSKAAPIDNIPIISPINKAKPPVFEVMPPIVDEVCFGYVCLPPGETPISLGLNSLSEKSTRTLETTTVSNKVNTAPTTGTYNIPVLLVKFPNLSAPSNYNVSMYNDVFNSSNYLSGNGISVKEYFKKSSYNQLNITYDVYDWRTMPNNYSFYYTNNNVHQLVVDAMNTFGTGSNAIDFTQYDSDNDGRIDGVILVHAGFPGQEQSGNILSQARLYRGTTIYSIQGKLYGNVAVIPSRHTAFACNSWKQTFNYPTDCRTSIDVAVHEYSHVLGLPDFYAITYSGQQAGTGLGGHTIMNMNSNAIQDVKKPVNFDSWSKFFFGWLTPTVINSASQANIYSLTSYDTTNSAFILHNPNTMGAKEFFIITNRYISTTSLDRYLFGTIPPLFNINGGIDILHIDENYIDYTYSGPLAFNSIMFDPDGDYYDDNVSHPGIVFEQNILEPVFPPGRSAADLYTTELPQPGVCSLYVFEGKFDNIARHSMPSSCPVYRDTTSRSYLTLQDSGIRVYGWSVGGQTMQAYLTVDEPLPLISQILSPSNGSSFGLQDNIDFQGSYQNNIGNTYCLWQYRKLGTSNFVSFSNQCQTTKTPSQLNLSEGSYSIRFRVTDEFNRQHTSTILITIVTSTTLYNVITSPIENKSYPFKEPVTFNASYYNNQGDVTCEWKYNNLIISNECNFTDTPFNLGIASPPYNSMVVINSSLPSFTILNKTLQTSPLFKEPLKVTAPTIKSPSYLGNFPAGFTRTITLTTTDASNASFVSSVDMKLCLCLLANNNQAAVR